jgi:hypothetical protein
LLFQAMFRWVFNTHCLVLFKFRANHLHSCESEDSLLLCAQSTRSVFHVKAFRAFVLFPVPALNVAGLEDFCDLTWPVINGAENGFKPISHAPKSVLAPIAFNWDDAKCVHPVRTVTVVHNFAPLHFPHRIATKKMLCRIGQLFGDCSYNAAKFPWVGLALVSFFLDIRVSLKTTCK